MELQQQFESAVARSKELTKRPSNEELLLDAGRQEIATALRRLAGQLEVVAKPDRSGIPAA